ncbi:MAG: hypothetical protein RIC51_10365 [Erythrobacter sp.]|uniref:hypothetical protein n=1 Tax=Erythrobacter sp. TaxID=1042 RepID=UPI0032EEE565
MTRRTDLGVGIIGLMFLALAVFEFLSGDDWVVWVVLGFLFGGFGAIRTLLGGPKS